MKNPLILMAGLSLVLLTTGCGSRSDVELDELRADNTRMASELDALSKENALLQQQRDAAREEARLARAQAEGLGKQLKDALNSPGLAAVGFEQDETGGIALGQDFAFDKGKATLNSAGQNAIGTLARELNSGDLKGTIVVVIGHTDTTPVTRPETKKKFTDNWGLSAMRASAVITALEKAGVNPKRLVGSFRGEHLPRGSNKAKNRRVNIRVSLPQ